MSEGYEVFDLAAYVRLHARAKAEAAAREQQEFEERRRGEVLLALKTSLSADVYQALLMELKPSGTMWVLNWHGVEYRLFMALNELRRRDMPHICESRVESRCAKALDDGSALLDYLSDVG